MTKKERQAKVEELYDSLTCEKIAEMLGVSVDTIRKDVAHMELRKYHIWSRADERWLIANYHLHSVDHCAAHIGTTIGAVRQRVSKLRKAGADIETPGREYKNQWTREEDKYIKDNFPGMSAKSIGVVIGRSHLSVLARVKVLRDLGRLPASSRVVAAERRAQVKKLLGRGFTIAEIASRVGSYPQLIRLDILEINNEG